MATTIFGQIIVGPPGSGKTTYCKFIRESLKQCGRNTKIINLDPANDCLPYKPAIDITELVKVETVMEETKLGPNGAMIFCMEQLQKNPAWLFDRIVAVIQDEKKCYQEMRKKTTESKPGSYSNKEPRWDDEWDRRANEESRLRQEVGAYRPYFLIDCPGQSELYTHHTAMKDIISDITRKNTHFDLRLTCVNLCDSYHAGDLSKYIGLVMNSLSTMLNLELPHVNVLSKVDKIEEYGKTRFKLEDYTDPNFSCLIETELSLDTPFQMKYKKLSESICSLIDDYSLVWFVPLNIQKAEDIRGVMLAVDKANGFFFDDLDLEILQMNPRLMEIASGKRLEPLVDSTLLSSDTIVERKPMLKHQ